MPDRLFSLTPTVVLTLLMGACATSPPPDSASPDTSDVRVEPPASVESSAELAADDLPSDVTECLPEAVRQQATAVAETARATDGGATYAVVEWTDAPEGREALVGSGFPVVLQLDDGACTSLLPPGTDVTVETVVPDAVAPQLSEQRLDWRIAAAGGPDAYADVLRDRHAGRLVECAGPPEGWTDCLAPALVERLRQRGVAVDRP